MSKMLLTSVSIKFHSTRGTLISIPLRSMLINGDGDFVDIKLFDYDNDGIDNIFTAFSSNEIGEHYWIVNCYNHNGNQILFHEEMNDVTLLNFNIFSDCVNNFLVTANQTGQHETTLRIYNLPSFTLHQQYVYSMEDFEPEFPAWFFEITHISVIDVDDAKFLNLGIHVDSEESGGGYYDGSIESYLSIFELSDQIEFICTIPDCDYVHPNSHISSGIYEYGGGSSGGGSWHSYNSFKKKIIYGNIPYDIIIWQG